MENRGAFPKSVLDDKNSDSLQWASNPSVSKAKTFLGGIMRIPMLNVTRLIVAAGLVAGMMYACSESEQGDSGGSPAVAVQAKIVYYAMPG